MVGNSRNTKLPLLRGVGAPIMVTMNLPNLAFRPTICVYTSHRTNPHLSHLQHVNLVSSHASQLGESQPSNQ